MSNTQYNWCVGMPVIMTADSGKGDIFYTTISGDYKGIVKEIRTSDLGIKIGIKVKDRGIESCGDNDLWWFYDNGQCTTTHPGMSIRPAEEEIRTYNLPNIETKAYIATPSQWIEGKAPTPRGRERGIVIWGALFNEPIYISKYEEIHREVGYTHWQYVQLPPPPPVAEVEAYGFLVWDEMYENKGLVNYDKVCRNDARRFYSQPATAEVLGRYLDTRNHGGCWVSNYEDMTLDLFINWYKSEYKTNKLLFTPAALKELGVK